jgi:hypothetical protein
VHTLPSTLRLPGPTPIGVVIRDTHLRCTWVNDTQGAKDGITVRQRPGRTLTETAPGPQPDMLEALMHQVLESGVPAIHTEYGLKGRKGDAPWHGHFSHRHGHFSHRYGMCRK